MEIRFGALAPPLSDAIKGIPAHYQKDADAITRLFIRGIITETECHKARIRLVKAIEKWQKKEGE